ncbi:hypothetical protein [Streptomyces sp. RerS4]|uniref:hypothetical protein n=1 Tax=Streptomyces sp. RerS4 TaxID=2942449 RepID=UPI00201C4803|nr:hypothetical protein [Streptomyces sp. RerS4]UQX05407.1 hypothetical protein M4D82_33540 [Streptomyces sp. RerS4]
MPRTAKAPRREVSGCEDGKNRGAKSGAKRAYASQSKDSTKLPTTVAVTARRWEEDGGVGEVMGSPDRGFLRYGRIIVASTEPTSNSQNAKVVWGVPVRIPGDVRTPGEAENGQRRGADPGRRSS